MSGIMLSFVGGAAVGGGGGGATITLYDLSLEDTTGAGACGYSMLNTGVAQGTEISDFEWCSPGSAAGNYEVYCQLVGSGGSPSFSGTTDTWLALSSTQTWVTTGSGFVLLAFAVRDTATHTTQATANISLSVP